MRIIDGDDEYYKCDKCRKTVKYGTRLLITRTSGQKLAYDLCDECQLKLIGWMEGQ